MSKYKVNIKGLWFAKVLEETDSGVKYGPVEKVTEGMQITMTPQISEGGLFGDGVKVDASFGKTAYEVAVQLTVLPQSVKSWMEGTTITNGVESGSGSDIPQPFAFGFEVEKTDKATQKIWFLYGKAKPIEESVQQSTENREYSNDSITISALQHKALNRFYTKIDSENTDVTEEMLENFFKVVQTTDEIKSVIEP